MTIRLEPISPMNLQSQALQGDYEKFLGAVCQLGNRLGCQVTRGPVPKEVRLTLPPQPIYRKNMVQQKQA